MAATHEMGQLSWPSGLAVTSALSALPVIAMLASEGKFPGRDGTDVPMSARFPRG
jgi:hypothetical protein